MMETEGLMKKINAQHTPVIHYERYKPHEAIKDNNLKYKIEIAGKIV